MKIDLKLSVTAILIVTATLQAVYNTKSLTRRNKSTLSIALDVANIFDKKSANLKTSTAKKPIKISLKFHEADMLELLLIQQIKTVDDLYIRQQIQNVINTLNQKLA